MRAQVFWRKVHYWTSLAAAVPVLVIIATGLLLQLKKDFGWIQPAEQRGAGGAPGVSFETILAVCVARPEVGVRSWEDVDRVDLRPEKSLLKVTTRAGWEVQLDPADGRVLQVAVRRSDVIESLHDGSWFGGAAVKRGVFLPAGLLLMVLWASGIYLFVLPRVRARPRTRSTQRALPAARPGSSRARTPD